MRLSSLLSEPFIVCCSCSGGAGRVQLSLGGTASVQQLRSTLDHSGWTLPKHTTTCQLVISVQHCHVLCSDPLLAVSWTYSTCGMTTQRSFSWTWVSAVTNQTSLDASRLDSSTISLRQEELTSKCFWRPRRAVWTWRTQTSAVSVRG